jgi:hypothetical protein
MSSASQDLPTFGAPARRYNVTLLYPLTDKIERDKDIRYLSLDGTKIKIRFIDLFELKKSLNAIIAEI